MKKYNILAGNFGSGKTELSVNIAINAAKSGKKTLLVDMDLINPYFKSSSKKELLEENGVELISPGFANTQFDTPSISPKIFTAFDKEYDFVVFDSGGDPDGATVLGILAERFKEHPNETEFFMVLNAMRPMQEEPKDIIDLMHEIEDCCNMKISAFINNTNLARDTDRETLIHGIEITKEVSRLTDIPVKYHAVMQDLANENADILSGLEIIPVDIKLRPDWFDEF